MATSSSEESSSITAPKVFHLSSSTDSPNIQKCPLCCRFKKVFYCKDCIHSGQFYGTKSRTTEQYINLQKALSELEENKRIVERDCLKLFENKQKSDVLHSKIRQAKERNRILRLALEEKKQRKAQYISKVAEIKEKNCERHERVKAYKTKSEALEVYVVTKHEDVDRYLESLFKKQEEQKKLVKLRIQQLFKYIFPISKVKPTIEMESSDDMVQALAEASQTTYIRDKWVYTDYSGEMKYSIVAPTLPGSGNYSAYNIWVAQNRDGVPGSNTAISVEQNPAFSISAALLYTAQLVNVLSFFLNIRLPYKMLYSDFCNSDMNEQQFSRKVARLNANVIYLCISQNINLNALRPNATIHNILQLTENEGADLGRQGPIQINLHQASALEQSLTGDLKVSEDSDSDEGDSFTVEWEAVPHVQCPEAPAGPANIQSTQMINTQQASSMAGGLVNSAVASMASIWRGFTGGR